MKKDNLDKLAVVLGLLARKTRTGQSLLLEQAKELISQVLSSETPDPEDEPRTDEDEIFDVL